MNVAAMAALDEIERCAREGLRCPPSGRYTKAPLGGDRGKVALNYLTEGGYIRIEIFARNFRQIHLLKGDLAGKATAPPPNGLSKPYRMIDALGDHWVTRAQKTRKIAP